MRILRKAIAFAWIAGNVAGTLGLTLYLFSCCALPFHDVLHRMLPVCGEAAAVLQRDHHHDVTPATTSAQHQPAVAEVVAEIAPAPLPRRAPELRNHRTLGSLRVDDDIGLHTLLATFLI